MIAKPATAYAGTRRPPRLPRALAPWAMALLGVLLAWYGQISWRAGGLGRLAVAVLGLAIGAVAVANLPRLRWWRARPVLAWLALFGALAASAALTWGALPTGETPAPGAVRAVVSAREEIMLLGGGALAGSALLALSRGEHGICRRGVAGFRWLWLAVLATTAPVALWEIGTDRHIAVTRWIDWYFTPHVPAASFANPNNYGCVLVAVVGTLLAWSLDRVPRWASGALLALAVVAAWLVWTTLSRGAFAAVAVQLLIAAVGFAARLGMGARLRASRAARAGTAAVGGLMVLGTLAAFTVPAIAARNPLLRAPKAGEAESDDLRINLIRAGLRYWRTSPFLGTGPGTYEYHLARERPPGVPDPTINAHNVFVEILSQYGLLAAVPLVVLLALLTWYVVRPGRSLRGAGPRPGPAAGPDRIAARVELAALLVAVVVTGLVVSSALAQPLWFVMLAHAVALAWSLDRDDGAAPRPAAATGCPSGHDSGGRR